MSGEKQLGLSERSEQCACEVRTEEKKKRLNGKHDQNFTTDGANDDKID